MPDNSITIVIPVFNRADELVRALSSLVDQTDKDFDVIVCDDGSTEDIYSKTKHYRDILRVKFIRIDNSGGPARPRNKAVEIVTATWVSFWTQMIGGTLSGFLNYVVISVMMLMWSIIGLRSLSQMMKILLILPRPSPF